MSDKCVLQHPLSVAGALFLCAVVLVPFVGLFYVSPKSISDLPRDHPKHVLYRLSTVTVSSLASSLFFRWHLGGFDFECYGLTFLGFGSEFWLTAVVIPAGLTLILYCGELVSRIIECVKTGDVTYTLLVNVSTDPLLVFRNLVFAPIIEEYTFRCLIVRALQLVARRLESGELIPFFTTTQLTFLAPLFFSAAHIHHVYRLHWIEGYPLMTAVLNITAMCLYTYLFGIFATFLLLKSGTLVAGIVAHVVCNFMGLPSLDFMRTESPNFPLRYGLLALQVFSIVSFGVAVYYFATLG